MSLLIVATPHLYLVMIRGELCYLQQTPRNHQLVFYAWVMSRESCHTYEWVISHRDLYLVMIRGEACTSPKNPAKPSTSILCMSHVTWIMSHIWMSHITQISVSRHDKRRTMVPLQHNPRNRQLVFYACSPCFTPALCSGFCPFWMCECVKHYNKVSFVRIWYYDRMCSEWVCQALQ